MNMRRILRVVVTSVACAAVLVAVAATGTGTPPQSSPARALRYQPGELLVKFKPDRRIPAATLHRRGLSFAAYTGSSRLDALHQRYGVTEIRPLIETPPPPPPGRRAVKADVSADDWNAHVRSVQQRFEVRAHRAATSAEVPDLSTIYLVRLAPDTDIQELALEYAADPSVEYAEPNYTYDLSFVPNDPFFSSSGSWGQNFPDLWGLHNIGSEAAWDLATGSGVTVAVLDTGLTWLPDIIPNVWTNPGEIAGNGIDDDGNGFIDDAFGWSFITASDNYFDGDGHGTHVSGTIAAVGNNANGIVGVAWQAKVMPVQIFGGFGTSSELIAAGLMYAADNGADVINMSFSGLGTSFIIRDAINYAAAHGVVLVASAGNDAIDVKAIKPANLDPVIAVAAVDHLDQPAFFSNFGGKIDLAAPGGGDAGPRSIFEPYNSILSLAVANSGSQEFMNLILTAPNDGSQFYLRLAGTSMAAPHVSGTAALILSRHPEFTAEQVRQALRDGADDLGPPERDARYGYGRLNAGRAVAFDKVAVARLHAPTQLSRTHGEPLTVEATVQNPGGPPPTWRLLFGAQGQSLTEIAAGNGEIDPGTLATIDAGPLARGNYTLRLEVSATDGAAATDSVTFTRLATRPYVRQLTDGSNYVVFPFALRPDAWSGDGHTIVYTEQVGAGFQRVVARDLGSSSDRVIVEFRLGPELLEGQDPVEAVISDDGKTIVCAAPEDLSTSNLDDQRPIQLFLFDVPTGSLTQVSHAIGGRTPDFRGLNINADGTRVTLVSRLDLDPSVGNADGNSELFYWDRTTGTFHQITSNVGRLVGSVIGTPAMSADGNTIAFFSYEDMDPSVGNPLNLLQIFLYDVAAASMRQLTRANPGQPFDSELAMTTDSSRLAAWTIQPTSPSRTLVLISTANGTVTNVVTTPQLTSSANHMAFSRDGQQIVFAADTATDRLFPPPRTYFPARELFQYDIVGQRMRMLTTLASGYLTTGLAVGPDGRVAFGTGTTLLGGDPEGTNDDGSPELHLLDPSLDGGYLLLKRGTFSRGLKGRDRFTLRGRLFVTGGAIDPVANAVAVTLLGANGQLVRADLPPGSLTGGPNHWHLSTGGTPLTTLALGTTDGRHYTFRLSGRTPGLLNAATPYVAVEIQIGSAIFGNAVEFRHIRSRLAYP